MSLCLPSCNEERQSEEVLFGCVLQVSSVGLNLREREISAGKCFYIHVGLFA